MLYLLWAILNIGIFLFIILLSVKTFKAIRERVGLVAAIIFVVGVASLIGFDSAGNVGNGSQPTSNWNYNADEKTERYSARFTTLVLSNNLISKYGLSIYYGKSKEDQKNIPINSFSFVSGLTSGTKWIPSSANVNTTDDNKKFQYEVNGVIEWRLLGFLIYSQDKTFRGIAELK